MSSQSLYEFLGVPYTAKSQEVEAAIDARMNETRRLVTNHNPEVAFQAQKDLRLLEEARRILLDPSS